MAGSYLGVPLLFIGFVLIVNAAWLQGKAESKDVGIMNLMVGVLGSLSAMYFGWKEGAFPLCAGALLFALTYLWVGVNAVRGAVDQRALGIYCLLVAIVTIPYAVKAFTGGDLGWAFEWLSYGLLWFFFFLLLGAQNAGIAKATTALTYFVGIEVAITGWVYLYGLWPFGKWWPMKAALLSRLFIG